MEYYAVIKNDFIEGCITILKDVDDILLLKEESRLQNVLTVFIYLVTHNILINLHA